MSGQVYIIVQIIFLVSFLYDTVLVISLSINLFLLISALYTEAYNCVLPHLIRNNGITLYISIEAFATCNSIDYLLNVNLNLLQFLILMQFISIVHSIAIIYYESF